MNDSPRDFDNPRYIGIDWGANPGKPSTPRMTLTCVTTPIRQSRYRSTAR